MMKTGAHEKAPNDGCINTTAHQTTAPRLSSAARKPPPICMTYCIARPVMAAAIIHLERSYRLFFHLTCRQESATMKALMNMKMKQAN